MSSKKTQLPNLVNSEEDEKALQAIVITDSFNERFIPITLDKPRCLLPLVNLPLIEYVFECLAISGVEEIILFTRHQTELIKQYVASSRWSKPNSVLQITIIVNQEAESVGDVLRDIDSRAIIHGDFVLINCADIVSNVNLSSVLTEHRVRRRLLPGGQNFIMTILTMPANPGHRTRERCESGVWTIEPVSGELLAYEQMECESDIQIDLNLSLDTIHAAASTATSCSSALMLLADSKEKEKLKQSSKKKGSNTSTGSTTTTTTGTTTTSLPSAAHAMAKSIPKEVRIRFDLIDCGIDICSPHVLALFTENFDYDDLRRDFIKGVLTSDILGVRLAVHVIPEGSYAARVRSPRLYDAISRDIIERWVYPIVPESNILETSPYIVKRNYIYQAPDVLLSRDSIIKSGSVIGSGTSIGMFGSSPPSNPPTPLPLPIPTPTTIEHSVIGKKCQIGVNVKIEGSYIWDGVKVSPGCRIKNSIISDGVTLLANTTLESGCLVGSNVTLGPNVTISRSSRITKLGEHCDMGAGLPLNSATEDDPEGCLMILNKKSRISLGEGSDGVLVSGSLGDYESYAALSFDALKRINNEDPFGSSSGCGDSTTSLDSAFHDAERESSFPTWIRKERQKAFTIDADNLFNIPILFDYLSEDEEAEIIDASSSNNNSGNGDSATLDVHHQEFEKESSDKRLSVDSSSSSSNRSTISHPSFDRPSSITPSISHLSSNFVADSQFLKGELGFLVEEEDGDEDLSLLDGDMDSLSLCSSKKSHSIFGRTDDSNCNTFGRNNTKFMREASDLIMHAIETNYLIDNALLELNSLKFSCNASFSECRAVLVGSIFTFIKSSESSSLDDSNSMAKKIDDLLSRWSPLLMRFTQGTDEQIDLICCTQKSCQNMQDLELSFQYVIPSYYKNDVVEQESIVLWWQQALKVLGSDNIYVRQIKNFVEWLEASDESDNHSDEDGDDNSCNDE